MKTSIVSVKVDEQDKRKAKTIAQELGLSLSAVIKAYLKEFLRTKRVNVGLDEQAIELSDWAKGELEKSEQDVKAGRVSPSFDNAEESIAWLNDPNAKYANGDPVQ